MVQMTRKQIIDSRFTIECPTCDYTLYGDEPRYFVKCDKCLEINAYDKKKKGENENTRMGCIRRKT